MHVYISELCAVLCSAIKTLGEAHEGESALQWVQKMRVLHEEKEKAEKRVRTKWYFLVILLL